MHVPYFIENIQYMKFAQISAVKFPSYQLVCKPFTNCSKQLICLSNSKYKIFQNSKQRKRIAINVMSNSKHATEIVLKRLIDFQEANLIEC